MANIHAILHITLDGVIQAPGRPDEDTRGGFKYGGWAIANQDEVLGRTMGEGMAHGGALLFGRRTYEDFYNVWPKRSNNPYTDVLNNTLKYVVSRTLREPLPWQHSVPLSGDATQAVAKLKRESGKDLGILGCGELVRSLARSRLIDQYTWITHPLVLGSGQRLFPEGSPYTALELTRSVTTTKGVVIGFYRPKMT